MRRTVSIAIAVLLAGGLATAAAGAPASYVKAAIADPARPKDDRDADAIRAPADTLAFAGVRPGMTVVEMFPGGGYFTRMIGDVVGGKGRVVAIENAGWKGSVKADQALAAEPGRANVDLHVLPFGQLDAAPASADVVWVTQNYHDLKIAQYGTVDTAEFNRRVFQALKPGGVYFILDHEAPNGTDTAGIAKLHRIEKAQVVREVTAAGFQLAEEGAFLRRPADDHTKPIFDAAIRGKTDQYALKFVKPRS
jgi:predicted methyltransferase